MRHDKPSDAAPSFPFCDIRFADIQMLRYQVPDFDKLTLRQKKLVYFLSEAALAGRDILWSQNCRYNLPIRHMLEAVYWHLLTSSPSHLLTSSPSHLLTSSPSHLHFLTYLRRVWFSNGIHHHYSTDKFRPEFCEAFLREALAAIHYPDAVTDDEGNTYTTEELIHVIFDPTILPKRVNQQDGQDLLLTSAMNYYAPGITQREAEQFYADMKRDLKVLKDPKDPKAPKAPKPQKDLQAPPMLGLNSRLERADDGHLYENTWKSGGMYGTIIDRIIHWLEQAATVAENDQQRSVIATLVAFYRTGDLTTFDQYAIQWVQQTLGDIDFTNGFTEVYGDPIGLKASWEGYVNITDHQATERTRKLSQNAQWFEDNSPTDPRFKKHECRGISAKVVNVAMLGGDLYPSSAIGINLPNSDYVRQHYGSKSVTLGNLTHAYAQAALGNGFREEFYHPEADVWSLLSAPPPVAADVRPLLSAPSPVAADVRPPLSAPSPVAAGVRPPLSAPSPVAADVRPRFSAPLSTLLDDLHTDLHECLGHGSGQLLPGVAPDALGPYGSTIEEARADLFALYFIADPKLVELGLVPDSEAYRLQYYDYMLNGLLTQLVRIEPGCQIEEAHMRNRALIARWCLRHSGAMQLTSSPSHPLTSSPSHYLLITSYPTLRQAIGQLLAEVQRIKSEGDLEAARQLVETYGISVDPELHNEILTRYRRLDLAPYKGFINPRYHVTRNADGEITDITLSYDETYDQQMLRYAQEYGCSAHLPHSPHHPHSPH